MNESDKANVLTTILSTYTAQLEETDRLLSNFSISVISVAVAIVSVIFALSENTNAPRHVFSYVFLSMPCLCSILLYVFAMMMRRVAIYRGNCAQIENELRSLTGSKNINLHGELMNKYYGTHGDLKSEANEWGPVYLGIFFVALYIVCFAGSISLRGDEWYFWLIWLAVLLDSLIMGILCANDLAKNSAVSDEIEGIERKTSALNAVESAEDVIGDLMEGQLASEKT